jgi:hypothetical protein
MALMWRINGVMIMAKWRKWQCGAAKKILMAINQPINGNDVA